MQWLRKINSLTIILITCLFSGAQAQQLNFDNYNKSNGLLNNEVHHILQSSSGWMYFGTPSGVSVYDGANFTNYDFKKGFLLNNISFLEETGYDSIRMYTNTKQFYTLQSQKLNLDSFPQHIAIKNTYKYNDQTRYAISASNIYTYTRQHLVSIPIQPGKSFLGINCIAAWQDSLLLVGRSYEPLEIYNIKTWERIAISKENLFVRNFCVDKDGSVWIASIGAGVLHLRPEGLQGNKIVFETLPAAFVPYLQAEFRSIVQDKNNILWMGSINHGLLKYNPVSKELKRISIDQGLASNTIFTLFVDRENNIWIGSNRGLQKLPEQNVFSYSTKQGLLADLVLASLPLPGNRIICSGYSGVSDIQTTNGSIRKWIPPLADEYFIQFLSLNGKYFGLSLLKLLELDANPAGLHTLASYPLHGHYRSMVLYQQNKIILGGDSSILLYNNKNISSLTNEKVKHVSCMVMDGPNRLWTANLHNAINGYTLKEQNNKTTAQLDMQYLATTNGPLDNIQCITLDKNKRILIGTSQSGITILQPWNNQLRMVQSITTASGLSNNSVMAMMWNNDSTLLCGNSNGLDKIIFTRDSFYIHNITDFYNVSNSVYDIQKDAAGNIVLGTESGLFILPTADIEPGLKDHLPISISAIRFINYPDSIVSQNNSIRLPYNNSGIDISFSAPSFKNEKDTKYTYLLAGSRQSNWSIPTLNNHISFLNLSPGKYRFIVKPVNMVGQVSKNMATVIFEIAPPFWQTWWFLGLLLLLTIFTIYYIARKRISNIRKQSSLRNKIIETEMMALRAQMNPHFIFNCMNIIDGLITSNRGEEAKSFLQKFSKLIRLILENSQQQAVVLSSDLRALQLYTEMESIRYNHQFQYHFQVDQELLNDMYKIPPLLIQPFVENAIVHGLRHKIEPGGKLLVSIHKHPNYLEIIVEDNGIGRVRSEQINKENSRTHQQIGIQLTTKRIDLIRSIHQERIGLSIIDLPVGTKVVLQLPLDFTIL